MRGSPTQILIMSTGHKFWARGYFVSTVGADEKVIKAYIQNQEQEDKRIDDLFNR